MSETALQKDGNGQLSKRDLMRAKMQRMRGNLRASRRMTALGAWTAFFVMLRLASRPLEFGPRALDNRVRSAIMKAWCHGSLRILGVHIEVEGDVPKGPYFMVANHLSYLDIIAFARQLGCVFVAMKEMADWPVVGFVVKLMNTIFVDRSSLRDAVRVNERIAEELKKRRSIMIFPESTCSTGEDVLKFHGALLQPALNINLPVHYATIEYKKTPENPTPETSICWTDDTPFHVHALDLLRVRRIHARIRFSPVPKLAPSRRELARELEEAVRKQLKTCHLN